MFFQYLMHHIHKLLYFLITQQHIQIYMHFQDQHIHTIQYNYHIQHQEHTNIVVLVMELQREK